MTTTNEPTPDFKWIIDNTPDSDTAAPAVTKFLEQAHGFVQRGTHECFLVARAIGQVLAQRRADAAHGNSTEARRGKMTWPDWVEKFCPFCIETANRYADIYQVTPETMEGFSELRITDAAELVRTNKYKDPEQREHKTPKTVKDKPPRPLGNAVRQVLTAAKECAASAQGQTRHSLSREADCRESFIADIVASIRLLIGAANTLISTNKELFKDKHTNMMEMHKALSQLEKVA